ncbi:DsrE family protein [Hydrogenovibrio sp. JE_KL2]|uniref:DsrE family protein n=1 Tax=Hydrogenovibrio sp. JE_KL2 TaxID=2651188 RepID=UPI0020A427A8|nr:DsrE family protein [Hydrogenovibrio sp. JE_KL2]
MKRSMGLLSVFGVLSLALMSLSFSAYGDDKSLPEVAPVVAKILAMQHQPDGVVFDIETLDENALPRFAPYVSKQIQLIRKKFPDVDIAVVTHGAEEFALQKKEEAKNHKLHDLFNQMVKDEGVSVHVCGAVAGLKQLTQEDFPDFVSFSTSGMAQLNDYKALGYTVVPIRQLNKQQRDELFEHPSKYLK